MVNELVESLFYLITQGKLMKNRFSIFRIAACFWLSIVFISTGFAHTPNQQDSIDKALLWLEQQQVNGVFETPQSSSIHWQASQEALEAFVITDELSHLNTQALVTFYDNKNNLETEFLSRRILLKLRLGKSFKNDLEILKTRQNRDGGFGSEPGFGSSVYDTAFALQALANSGNKATSTASGALSYIKTQQSFDGSFSVNAQNSSTNYITALVLRALQPYIYTFDIGSVLSKAQSYLDIKAQENSGWVNDWEAAQFLLAIVPTTTDSEKYQKTVDWLKLQQLDSGAWQGDVFATALAIQALYLSENISHPTAPDKSTLNGRLLDANNKQPLYGAIVQVDADRSVATNSQGVFSFSGLDEGQHQVSYLLDGYYSASQNISITKPQLIDVGDIYLNQIPNNGMISGVIVSTENNSPLSGVSIRIEQNGATQETFSDVQGRYQLLVSEGQVFIALSHANYHGASASANIENGAHLQFSVGLTPINDDVIPLKIEGRLVDAVTLQPIAAAIISIQSTADTNTTNDNGYFELHPTAIGEQVLHFTKSGYYAAQSKIILPNQGLHNLGTILLEPMQVGASKVYGYITDANTGEGIAGARVSIEGQTTTTNTDGFYTIENVEAGEFVIGAQANTYSYASTSVRLKQASALEINLSMLPIEDSGIGLSQVETNSPEYKAYQPVKLSAVIENNTVRERHVILYVHILDANGQVLDRFSASELPLPPSDDNPEAWAHYQQHINDATERLGPNEIRNINLDVAWNSGQQAPGEYVALVQVLDAISSVTLAEQATSFSILPTQEITEVVAQLSPSYALVGSQAELHLKALLRNSSNQPIQGMMIWKLHAPDNTVIATGQKEFDVDASNKNSEIQLDTLTTLIEASGNYSLNLELQTSAETGHLVPAVLLVPPYARLTVEQDLTPQQVLPGIERRSQVRIQIKGVEGE